MNQPLNMIFDEVAELYDAVRPGYPSQLVDTVAAVLKPADGRILEVGVEPVKRRPSLPVAATTSWPWSLARD